MPQRRFDRICKELKDHFMYGLCDRVIEAHVGRAAVPNERPNMPVHFKFELLC